MHARPTNYYTEISKASSEECLSNMFPLTDASMLHKVQRNDSSQSEAVDGVVLHTATNQIPFNGKGPGWCDLRRKEELAEAAVEERDTGLEDVSFTFAHSNGLYGRTPKTRRLRTMVVFSGEVASS